MTRTPAKMPAFVVDRPGPIGVNPLVEVERDVPEPGPREVLVEVNVCGVCRTDLHLAEGVLAPRRALVTPGHEVVGTVIDFGADSTRFSRGDRVGVAWLAGTCGACPECRRGAENLCRSPRFTGWDLDGGYAPYLAADERYVYALPDAISDELAAPLLCAGILGYRALRRAAPHPGGRLGIYGFGTAAHFATQVAIAEGIEVHIVTRSAPGQRVGIELGAASASERRPPVSLDAAVVFSPRSEAVPAALEALGRGGTCAIAGVNLSDMAPLEYERHLFNEKTLTSVTENTRRDGEEFLALAARIGVSMTTSPYQLSDTNLALQDLAAGRVEGAAVLRVA